jgi:hypothetical protein
MLCCLYGCVPGFLAQGFWVFASSVAQWVQSTVKKYVLMQNDCRQRGPVGCCGAIGRAYDGRQFFFGLACFACWLYCVLVSMLGSLVKIILYDLLKCCAKKCRFYSRKCIVDEFITGFF